MNGLKISKLNFTLIFIFFIIILWLISYVIIIPNYKNIETKKNNVNINTVLSHFDTEITNLKNIINDYSKWDDTYNFINDKNGSYIYENFREGTSTLSDLHIDMIFYTDKSNNIIFNKYTKKMNILDKNNFMIKVIDLLKDIDNFYSIESIDKKLFIIVKLEVKKSDGQGDSNGFIYSLKIIDEGYIKNISNVFEQTKLSLIKPEKNYVNTIENKYIKRINSYSYFEDDKIYSNIGFFSKDRFLFNLEIANTVEVLDDGLRVTYYYNFIITILLALFVYSSYKKQKTLQHYNEKLELEVQKRTENLDNSIRLIEEKNKELYKLSTIDSLTNIKNRRSFFLQSKELLTKANEENKNYFVLLIDIDHFKKINDNYGHAIGDSVLQEFCLTILSIIDIDAVFGRIGGEEFCVSLFDKDEEYASSLAERIRKKCDENIMKIDNIEVKFTISIGISSNKNKEEYIDEILQNADDLLYTAKRTGRNKVIRNV